MKYFCGHDLWDDELLNSTDPVFSSCFQHTILIWIPVAYTWVLTMLLFSRISAHGTPALQWSWSIILKLIASAFLVIDTAILLFYNVARYSALDLHDNLYNVDIVYPLLLVSAMLNIFVSLLLCKRRGVITSGILFVGWVLYAFCGTIETWARSAKLRQGIDQDDVEVVLFFIYYILIVFSLVLSAFADRPHQSEITNEGTPEFRVSFLNQITFWWFTKFAMLGWRRDLTDADMWELNERDKSQNLSPCFNTHWNKAAEKYYKKKAEVCARRKIECKLEDEEVKIIDGKSTKSKKSKDEPSTPSMISVMFKCYWRLLVPAMFMKIFSDSFGYVAPLILKALIEFVQDKSIPQWRGYFLVGVLFVNNVVCSSVLNQYFLQMFRAGMRIKSVLIGAVYDKALKLSSAARQKSTLGEIVNIMSVDIQRVSDITTYINLLWSTPYQMTLALTLLYLQLGPSIFAGVGVMVLLAPMNGFLSMKIRKLQQDQMKLKDERIKLMNEILGGVKILKLYAWEPPFQKMILEIREKEMRVMRTAAYFNSFVTLVFSVSPFFVAVLTFAVYVLSDPVNNILTPSKAFVSLTLFNMLRFPISMLPMIITFMLQAGVSNTRIKNFLVMDELPSDVVERDEKCEHAIEINNGSFSWEESVPVLNDINMQISDGELIAVIGPVGCGKSSLISAVLGELQKNSGTVKTKGKIAFVPQQAWIQNKTLRDNITFMEQYDPTFYDDVVQKCQLKQDISILPGGDATEIGEKGINLSGGQKQRISLARAVYQKADVYLLDDPLSAVDAHVGKSIFEGIFSATGLLAGKTRVLVTHGLTYLKDVDRIIVMSEGRISEIGSYQELMAKRGLFQQLLESFLLESSLQSMEEDVEIIQELEKYDPALRQRLESHLSNESFQTASDQQDENGGSPVKRHVSGQDSVRRSHSGSPAKKVLTAQNSRRRSSSTAAKDDERDQLLEKQSGKPTTIMVAEKVETGSVSRKVYLYYIRAISYKFVAIVLVLYALNNCCALGSNFWLANWSDRSTELARMNQTDDQVHMRLGVYAVFGFGQAIFVFIAAILLAYAFMRVSRNLHFNMLDNILRSPMSFFDVTPLGRILNRFSKDIDVVDNTLPQTVRSWLLCVLSVISTLITIIITTPLFLIVIGPVGILYFLIQRLYVAVSRQLKRLESISRSPIYTHFQESVQGASSIRAYGAQERFMKESQLRVDQNQMRFYPNMISNRWLGTRLEIIGVLIMSFAALFAVIARENDDDGVTPGLVGLSMSYAMTVTQTLNWAVRMSSELEANIVGVERIQEYSETDQEAAWVSEEGKAPIKEWPTEGVVKFDSFSVRYRPGLDLVLKEVNCQIEKGEKVGIVGRTGAGKSSMTQALFRLIEAAEGKIIIDGVDIASIGLHDLRSRLTIIPQDPVLFSGTLRTNLDPFNKYDDVTVWNALEHSYLKKFVSELPDQLMHNVSEGGENLSVGQRQLVCLARALLRKTQVLVLDEATGSIDVETDEQVQRTIRTEFSSCTLLVIAHRLNTIIDSDRILVLDSGKVAEFDTPKALLSNEDSLFHKMAKDAGIV